jgi:outer membrane biosynthesis protein TonB
LQSSVNKTKEKNDEAMDEFKGVFVGLPLLDIGFFWSPGRVRPERVTPARQNQQEKPGEPARPQQVSPAKPTQPAQPAIRPERVVPVKPDQSEKIHPPAKKEKIHPPENDPKKQKEKTDIHER